MTHKLKVKKLQLSSAKRFDAVEEKPPAGVTPPQYHLGYRILFFLYTHMTVVTFVPMVKIFKPKMTSVYRIIETIAPW